MKGRPRKPASIKILEGSYRKDRDGPLSGPAPGGTPTPPAYLEGEALASWNDIAPGLIKLKVVADIDSTMLGLLCWWHAQARRAMAALDKAGLDDKARRRLVALASLACTHFDKIACRFGMTPADRARLRVVETQAPGVNSRRRD